MEKHSTIQDVARVAGVSIATVSRALSGGSVSERTREKVEDAARQVDYRGVASRPNSERGMNRSIAMVLSSQVSPYYAALCEGATAEAVRSGYRVLDLTYPEGTGIEMVMADLLDLQPVGVLLAGFAVENALNQETTRTCLQRLQKEMPLVAIGPPIEGIECARLTSDPSQCVRKAMAHLTMLGHRRIGFIGGVASARFSIIRESAYIEEGKRFGCDDDPGLIMRTGVNAQAGELGMSILLGNRRRALYPTAVFCINDLVALGAMKEIQKSGLRVPEDIAVVGCDNAFFAAYLTPSLTTVDLHPFDHGRSAMSELVMSIHAGHPISFNQAFESSLIVRESCGASLGVRHFSAELT
ncbi:MAG: LacI family DNA-binding transcriptional regulator [Clostridia bacterium]|nr:LacI family DNA-binding transcriptional regulator [Clostridia bacterium]